MGTPHCFCSFCIVLDDVEETMVPLRLQFHFCLALSTSPALPFLFSLSLSFFFFLIGMPYMIIVCFICYFLLSYFLVSLSVYSFLTASSLPPLFCLLTSFSPTSIACNYPFPLYKQLTNTIILSPTGGGQWEEVVVWVKPSIRDRPPLCVAIVIIFMLCLSSCLSFLLAVFTMRHRRLYLSVCTARHPHYHLFPFTIIYIFVYFCHL